MKIMISAQIKFFGHVVFINEIESFITSEYHLKGLRFFKSLSRDVIMHLRDMALQVFCSFP